MGKKKKKHKKKNIISKNNSNGFLDNINSYLCHRYVEASLCMENNKYVFKIIDNKLGKSLDIAVNDKNVLFETPKQIQGFC